MHCVKLLDIQNTLNLVDIVNALCKAGGYSKHTL